MGAGELRPGLRFIEIADRQGQIAGFLRLPGKDERLQGLEAVQESQRAAEVLVRAWGTWNGTDALGGAVQLNEP